MKGCSQAIAGPERGPAARSLGPLAGPLPTADAIATTALFTGTRTSGKSGVNPFLTDSSTVEDGSLRVRALLARYSESLLKLQVRYCGIELV
jgi:hypothetical protein